MTKSWLIFLFLIASAWSSYAEVTPRDQQKTNINTASVSELTRLPHIGEKRAKAIIYLREKRPFVRYTQLLKVKGIGRKTLKKLKPYIQL